MSNIIKPVEDLLKRCEILKDDRHVWKFKDVQRSMNLNQREDTIWQAGNGIPAKGQVVVLLHWSRSGYRPPEDHVMVHDLKQLVHDYERAIRAAGGTVLADQNVTEGGIRIEFPHERSVRR